MSKNLAIRVALLFLNFCTGIIVARHLGPAGRGEFAVLGLSPILLAALATFGLPSALIYESRRRPAEEGQLFGAAMLLSLLIGLVVCGIGVLCVPLWIHGYPASVIREAQWLMILSPEVLTAYVLRAYLEAKGEFTKSILTVFVPALFLPGILIALALLHRLSAETAILAYNLPAIAQTLFLAFRLRRRMHGTVASFIPSCKILFSYGFKSYGIDVVAALSGQMDQAIIVSFVSPAALGLYTVALSVSRLTSFIQQTMGTVLFPLASGLERGPALQIVARGARITFMLSAIGSIGLVVIVPYALPIVYGVAFSPAITLFFVLIVESLLASVASMAAQAFRVTGRPGVVASIQVVWLVATATLLALIVPRMGLMGAAYALLLSSVLRLCLTLLAYPVTLKEAIPSLVPSRADLFYLIAKMRGFWDRGVYIISSLRREGLTPS